MHSDVIHTIFIDVINDMIGTDVLFCCRMCDFDPGTHAVIYIQFCSLKLDVTRWYQSRPSRTRARVDQVARTYGAWRVWALRGHGMAYVLGLDTDVCQEGKVPGRLPILGYVVPVRRGRRSFEGGCL